MRVFISNLLVTFLGLSSVAGAVAHPGRSAHAESQTNGERMARGLGPWAFEAATPLQRFRDASVLIFLLVILLAYSPSRGQSLRAQPSRQGSLAPRAFTFITQLDAKIGD